MSLLDAELAPPDVGALESATLFAPSAGPRSALSVDRPKDAKVVTRSELALRLSTRCPQLRARVALEVVDVFIDELVCGLAEGKTVKLRQLGVLQIAEKPRRRKRGCTAQAQPKAKRVAVFSPSAKLAKRIKAGAPVCAP